MLIWNVLHHNINTDCIETYNVLAYREEWIKKSKKACKTKQNFSEKLEFEMKSQYWSRAEYELILEREDNQLYIKPFRPCVGSCNPEKVMIRAAYDSTIDWVEFSKWDKLNWLGNEAKIDVYDQLKFRWEDFVNYCWNTGSSHKRKQNLYAAESTAVNKIIDNFTLDTALCSDPEWVHKENELFNSAEHWLNYLGIKTRTEYGNLLPTYNLFLEIGKYLKRRVAEENDE